MHVVAIAVKNNIISICLGIVTNLFLTIKDKVIQKVVIHHIIHVDGVAELRKYTLNCLSK